MKFTDPTGLTPFDECARQAQQFGPLAGYAFVGIVGTAIITSPEFRQSLADAAVAAWDSLGNLGAGLMAASDAVKDGLSKRHTPDQEALSDLAKTAKRNGIDSTDADTLLDWSKETGMNDAHDDRGTDHWEGGDHIHAGGQDHIPVNAGSTGDNNSSSTGTTTTDSSGSVICTELYKQGYITDYLYTADGKFGKSLELKFPLVLKGYRFIAAPIVRKMKESKTFTNYVNIVACHWVNEMAYRMGYIKESDILGSIIMFIGIPLAFIVGLFISNLKLSMIICMFFFMLVFMVKKRLIVSKKERSDILKKFL